MNRLILIYAPIQGATNALKLSLEVFGISIHAPIQGATAHKNQPSATPQIYHILRTAKNLSLFNHPINQISPVSIDNPILRKLPIFMCTSLSLIQSRDLIKLFFIFIQIIRIIPTAGSFLLPTARRFILQNVLECFKSLLMPIG